jgi:hypothetical protein
MTIQNESQGSTRYTPKARKSRKKSSKTAIEMPTENRWVSVPSHLNQNDYDQNSDFELNRNNDNSNNKNNETNFNDDFNQNDTPRKDFENTNLTEKLVMLESEYSKLIQLVIFYYTIL